jgi:hypothetical protein
MFKIASAVLTVLAVPFWAFAIDGQVLINNSTVLSLGGYPYVISVPGSYKLSGNLTAPAGVTAIVVTASNSVLDLNGFTVQCSTVGTGNVSCITDGGSATAIHDTTIRNGIVIASATSPANLYTLNALRFSTASQRMTIEGLKIQLLSDGGNSGEILTLGPNSIVRGNTFSLVGGDFTLLGSCPSLYIENVLASGNYSISANLGCILVNNIKIFYV